MPGYGRSRQLRTDAKPAAQFESPHQIDHSPQMPQPATGRSVDLFHRKGAARVQPDLWLSFHYELCRLEMSRKSRPDKSARLDRSAAAPEFFAIHRLLDRFAPPATTRGRVCYVPLCWRG